MKNDFPPDLPDQLLRERFGDLSEEELAKLRTRLLDEHFEPDRDGLVHKFLEDTAARSGGEVPPLPEGVRRSFEQARLSAENAASEPDVYATPKRYEAEKTSTAPASRWHSIAVIGGGLAAAAAIVIAYVTYIRPVERAPAITYADDVMLLTPGEVTGFLEPVFTWKAGNGGVVDVKVLAPDGGTVATLDRAFSPLRWAALERFSALSRGEAYELELSTPNGLVSRRRFETAALALGAPEPEDSLEGIIEQCQELIASNRPADAWMLWGELTAAQKSDPRMQELKDQILRVIAG